MSFYQFKSQQEIPATVEEVWDFIASPANLKKITPDYMGFDVTSGDLPDKMYAGMIVSYKVKPVLGIPTEWVTEITHIEEGNYFIDEQRKGPYKIWHHEHRISPTANGVLMEDIISYQMPLGFLGRIAHSLFVRKKIESVFDYRTRVLNQIFPKK